MVPFFEKKSKIQKNIYINFNKDLIYTLKINMKKNILNLLNKKVSFPLDKKHQKTIKYYLGETLKTLLEST